MAGLLGVPSCSLRPPSLSPSPAIDSSPASAPVSVVPELLSPVSSQNWSCSRCPIVPPQCIDPASENPSLFNPDTFLSLPTARVSTLLVHQSGSMPLNSSEPFGVKPFQSNETIVNAASPLSLEQNSVIFGSGPSIESGDHAQLFAESSLREKSATLSDPHFRGDSHIPVADPPRRQNSAFAVGVLSSPVISPSQLNSGKEPGNSQSSWSAIV